jgi:hypothetical protein
MAAKGLGIDLTDIVKGGAEDMEGALPMERFLAEKEQNTFAKIMTDTKGKKQDST